MTREVLHRLLESEEAAAPRVRFVAAHHSRPLLRRHRSGARVGQQVDDHFVGMQPEEIEAGAVEGRLAFFDGRQVDRLDGVDTERFDDGAVRHGVLSLRSRSALILAAAAPL
jgi:hypothetical protein